MSALHGDNVITRSERTPWFDGMACSSSSRRWKWIATRRRQPFRLPVQLVLRPTHEFRGYAGQMLSGTVRPAMR